mgnify:CR=1 FL=1
MEKNGAKISTKCGEKYSVLLFTIESRIKNAWLWTTHWTHKYENTGKKVQEKFFEYIKNEKNFLSFILSIQNFFLKDRNAVTHWHWHCWNLKWIRLNNRTWNVEWSKVRIYHFFFVHSISASFFFRFYTYGSWFVVVVIRNVIFFWIYIDQNSTTTTTTATRWELSGDK